jgi:hypothetical protein
MPKNPAKASAHSVAATTRNMADAVGYLSRVAAEAQLGNIARRLANIRVGLLTLAANETAETHSPSSKFDGLNGDTDARRKLS